MSNLKRASTTLVMCPPPRRRGTVRTSPANGEMMTAFRQAVLAAGAAIVAGGTARGGVIATEVHPETGHVYHLLAVTGWVAAEVETGGFAPAVDRKPYPWGRPQQGRLAVQLHSTPPAARMGWGKVRQ